MLEGGVEGWREGGWERACEIEGEGESERGGSLIHFNELPV